MRFNNATSLYVNNLLVQKAYLNNNIVWQRDITPILEYNTFDTNSYNGSGTTIYDISGNDRDGTITGSPTWTTEYFTFADDYITTPNLNSIIPASNEVHSVELWVYPTDNGVLVQYNNTTTPNSGYHFSAIELVGGNLEVALWSLSGITSTGNIGAVSFNQWHQIVLTYDGSVCKGYIDGVFKGSVNVSFYSPQDISGTFYMNFGYRDTTSQGDGTDFNGRFGIMRVYNVALTDAQVLSNYNSTVSVVGGLVLFTSVGTTSWTAPVGVTEVEYLVVAGAGGGGNGYDNAGGAGGGAGMVLTGSLSVTPGESYTVTVGDGGNGGADTRTNNAGSSGENSVFATITALGGGFGAGSRTGGSVGLKQVGSTTAPTGGTGSGGGQAGKGGGGATGDGTSNSGSTPGTGGAGLTSTISGTSVTYGVGGNGGTNLSPTTNGADGTTNRGNGGNGGSSTSSDSASGGKGGSGIVIIKY
jgi:hypothetical protein